MLSSLPFTMWYHTLWPGANHILLYVSIRTAGFPPQIIDRNSKVTCDLGRESESVVRVEYMIE